MLSICVPYPPPPGGIDHIECDEIRWLRRETGDKSLILYQGGFDTEREWIVAVKLQSGQYCDIAGAGGGVRPRIGGGTVESIKSLSKAGASGAMRKMIAKEGDRKERNQREALMGQNTKWQELLGRMQKIAPGTAKDHPRFNVLKKR